MAKTPNLAKLRKDALVEMVVGMEKECSSHREKVIGAAVLGGILGTLIGLGW